MNLTRRDGNAPHTNSPRPFDGAVRDYILVAVLAESRDSMGPSANAKETKSDVESEWVWGPFLTKVI